MPTYRTFTQHLDPSYKPKRILALDGGGIRGVLTAGLLRRMEDILRARAGGDPNFRLSDYFDLIGGTSTGSIIAAGLSLGMTAEEVRDHYFTLGERDVQAQTCSGSAPSARNTIPRTWPTRSRSCSRIARSRAATSRPG